MTARKLYPSILALLLAIFNKTASAYDWTCNLFCYNKGQCRHGYGKFGSYAGIDSQMDDLPFEQELHDDGMYCTCPEGYTGLQCEIKYVTCGKDDHTCFNGSACVRERASDTGKVYYRCECDASESIMDAPYAGKYCEHIATVFCGASDGFQHGGSFCTNGGKCKAAHAISDASPTKHVGCDCPDGLEGGHCETKIVTNVATIGAELVHEIEALFGAGDIVGIVAGLCAGIALLLCCFRRRRITRWWSGFRFRASSRGRSSTRTTDRRNQRGRKKQQEMGSYSDAARSNTDTGDII